MLCLVVLNYIRVGCPCLLYRKSCEVWAENPSHMKRFNRHSLSIRFMTPNRSCIPERTDNRPRNLCRGSLEMFLASLLYVLKCLRIDLFKIDCCLHVSVIIWFLYVLNSIKNACRVFIALADRMTYFMLVRI